jgi:hypothetical protein
LDFQTCSSHTDSEALRYPSALHNVQVSKLVKLTFSSS